MIYDLPESVDIGGTDYKIRSDYRAVLDICTALSDIELNDQDKALVSLNIFYPDLDEIPEELYQEALEKCFWFISGGKSQEEKKKTPQLMDWEKDFPLIVSPVNRVIGREIRSSEHLHWWTFLSAYYEIGDCLFAQVVRIREKKAKGKPLDKSDREFYRQNRDLIDIKTNYSEAEKSALSAWGVK